MTLGRSEAGLSHCCSVTTAVLCSISVHVAQHSVLQSVLHIILAAIKQPPLTNLRLCSGELIVLAGEVLESKLLLILKLLHVVKHCCNGCMTILKCINWFSRQPLYGISPIDCP